MLYQTRLTQIENANIFRFQRLAAIFFISACILAIVVNIIFVLTKDAAFDTMIINIITVILLLIPYTFSYFKNLKISQYMQIIITFVIGFLSLIFNTRTQYVGDIIIILSALLMIKYKIIKPINLKIRYIIIICLSIMLVRGLFLSKTAVTITYNLMTTMLSGILIGFSLLINQDDVKLNNRIKNDNQTLIRYGYNFGALLHGMNFIELLDTIKKISDANTDHWIAKKLLIIEKELKKHRNLKNLYLENFKKNYEFTHTDENIIPLVISIIDEEAEINRKIIFKREFSLSEVTVKIIPFEFQCIIRNLLSNAVEAILSTKTKVKQIIIKIYADKENVLIQIDDSGNGLIGQVATNEEIKTTKKHGGGFGLRYIRETIAHYRWTICFYKSTILSGASITIKIPNEGVLKCQ